MTPLTQENQQVPRSAQLTQSAALDHQAVRNPLPRLRRLVPKQHHPFGWIAAERIAAAQARLFRQLAHDAGLDPVAFMHALPNLRIRHDDDLPRPSLRHWDPIGQRWIITTRGSLTEAARRFLVLREFKHIIDDPYSLQLYDADHERGPAQAEMAGDHFASCVLMPAAAMRSAVRDGIRTIPELAAHFTAPKYRVGLRLSDLNLITKITE